MADAHSDWRNSNWQHSNPVIQLVAFELAAFGPEPCVFLEA
jgi:hypothetical protein